MSPIKKTSIFFKELFSKPIVILPYLITVLFIFNEYRFLFREHEPPIDTALYFALFLLFFSLLSHLLFRLIFNNKYIAGILCGYFIMFCLFYFYFYNLLGKCIPWMTWNITSGYNILITLIFICLGIILLFIFRKLNRKIRYFNTYLNVIITLFILVETGKWILHEKKEQYYESFPSRTELVMSNNSVFSPDIYYIVFDSYTSSQSLKKYWDFDNSELDDFLQEKGFYNVKNSFSNYNCTDLSISSTLNLSYHNIKSYEEYISIPYIDIVRLPSESFVAYYLKCSGYEIKPFTVFDFMGVDNYYDIDYSCPDFYNKTIFNLIISKIYGRPLVPVIYPAKEKNFEVFDSVIYSAKKDAPQFLYAHIYLPHYPFFFDEYGNEMTTEYALSDMAPDKYLKQLKFTNSLIIKTLNKLLNDTASDKIIIIQGDHGFRYIDDNECLSILNAYYFPDKDYCLLYDSITPVNSFRVILNKYFGMHLPLLKDTSYYFQEEKVLEKIM